MVLIFATSSYILNRKVFIPTLKLTKQFTSNRTQIFRNIKVVSSLSNDFRSNRHSGLLANITRTTQFFWVQISDAIKLSIRTGQLTILFGPILCIGVVKFKINQMGALVVFSSWCHFYKTWTMGCNAS